MDFISAYFSMCFVSIGVNLLHVTVLVEKCKCISLQILKWFFAVDVSPQSSIRQWNFFNFISRNYTQSSLAIKKRFLKCNIKRKKNVKERMYVLELTDKILFTFKGINEIKSKKS